MEGKKQGMGGFRREEVMTREILRLRGRIGERSSRQSGGVGSRGEKKKVTGRENEAEKLSAGIINGND